MQEQKHTPLPYVHKIDFDKSSIILSNHKDYQRQVIAYSLTQPNAEFIVLACDSHYDLIHVLDMLLNNDEVEIFDKAIELGGHRSFSFKEWAEKARSTVVKAKGEV